jgi:hypothetical protein
MCNGVGIQDTFHHWDSLSRYYNANARSLKVGEYDTHQICYTKDKDTLNLTLATSVCITSTKGQFVEDLNLQNIKNLKDKSILGKRVSKSREEKC